MFTITCSLEEGLWLELGLDFVSGWLVVMHKYLYYRLSLSHCRKAQDSI